MLTGLAGLRRGFPQQSSHTTHSNVFAVSRAFEQLLRPEMATGGRAEDKAWTWKKRKTRLAANTSRSICILADTIGERNDVIFVVMS